MRLFGDDAFRNCYYPHEHILLWKLTHATYKIKIMPLLSCEGGLMAFCSKFSNVGIFRAWSMCFSAASFVIALWEYEDFSCELWWCLYFSCFWKFAEKFNFIWRAVYIFSMLSFILGYRWKFWIETSSCISCITTMQETVFPIPSKAWVFLILIIRNTPFSRDWKLKPPHTK